jgi:hypothetical protein
MTSYIDFHAVTSEYLATHPHSSFYFLLDHAGMPGLHRKLRRSTVKWVSLFEDRKECNALLAAPILVLAGTNGKVGMSRALCDWIGTNGTYTSTVVALASNLSSRTLKERLAARLDVRLSEQMDGMLRFFDPRVFEQLTKILSVEQAQTFFSPAEQWWYVDRAGKLVSLQTTFDADEKLDYPVEFTEAQEFELIEASEPDQVLALIKEHVPGLISSYPPHLQHEFINRNVRAAREIGLSSVLDFVLYIGVVLMKGDDFINGQSWARVCGDVKEKRLTISDAIEEIEAHGNGERA